ncbi:hypothetical protein LSH36_682g01063 [Paralvinella palmiformis]|uniref:MULE transposase domain-containing protein n=1 Tax=Paralvinella palmiformis TaxID=53620 RepID=A0AAD9J333_9ANNE|nr:hypothetical protein LSH36_682g01063 [Paralvinella palmiformis]
MDYEGATWQVVRAVFPGIEIQGCLFHFMQAVYRKVQELGLQTAYSNDPGTNSICGKLVALPLLPQEHIITVFKAIVRQAWVGIQAINNLIEYVRSTWVVSQPFPPRGWSVFGQSVRTNNNCEGWHYRLNHRGKRAKLPFYLLVQLLHKEARIVNIQVTMVYQEDLTQDQHHGAANITSRMEKLWVEYSNGSHSALSLIATGSHLISPKGDITD